MKIFYYNGYKTSLFGILSKDALQIHAVKI